MKILFVFMLLVTVLVACQKDDDDEVISVSGRTVLVYIAGDNSLSSCVDYDINEMLEGMQSVDDSENNLLVYIDKGVMPELVRLKRDNKGQVIKEMIATYDNRNSVSVANMKEVVETAFSEYPATGGYGLVLWSHGEGWIPSSGNATRWWGEDRSNHLDITDLREILKAAPHLDFLMFDACFMQSIEVAYELRDCTSCLIGSPAEIPAPGAPYQKVVPAMFTVGEVAINVAKAYFEYYADPELYTGALPDDWNILKPWTAGVSVGVIDTRFLADLASVTKQLLPLYIQNKREISTSEILSYDRRLSRYYYDFDGLMKTLCTSDKHVEWKNIFDRVIVYWRTTERNYSSSVGDFSMEGASGLSTFIPRLGLAKDYTKCIWYSVSGWNGTGW